MTVSFSLDGDYVQPLGVATFWRLEENKIFEVALAKHYFDADRYDRIASYLPNKTPSDVRKRFRELEGDLRRIDEGCDAVESAPSSARQEEQASKRAKTDMPANGDRRKGVPWTEEEHRMFLLGLAKFGKGDWRSIARNFVVTRTPTQVASHAQKYFIRLNSMSKKDKRRASIHDITSPTLPACMPNLLPTTGLASSACAAAAVAAAAAAAAKLDRSRAATPASTSSTPTPTSSLSSATPSGPATASSGAAGTALGQLPSSSAAAAMAAAAAAAAAAGTSSVFAQLAMHGMTLPGSAAGLIAPMAMPTAPYMVHV